MEEHATRTLLDGIQKMITKWKDDRQERLKNTVEDIEKSLETGGETLSLFQTDFESMVSAYNTQNDERSSLVQKAEERVLDSEDTFTQLNNHISHMHSQAATYQQRSLDELADNKQLIDSISSEIDSATPQRTQSRPMLTPIDQNVRGVKRGRGFEEEELPSRKKSFL